MELAPYTITAVSVYAGDEYNQPGTFTTTADAEAHVARSFRGVSSYWRAWVYDAQGRRVVECTRAGPGGTGERWTFEPVPGGGA